MKSFRLSEAARQPRLQRLIERFAFSDVQAQAIVDMRLRALTGLEREKLENEHRELLAKIAELKAILADEKLLLGVIKEEMMIISEKFGDERRSHIGFDVYDIDMEDLIPKDNIAAVKESKECRRLKKIT